MAAAILGVSGAARQGYAEPIAFSFRLNRCAPVWLGGNGAVPAHAIRYLADCNPGIPYRIEGECRIR
jgi:hypothetical protein